MERRDWAYEPVTRSRDYKPGRAKDYSLQRLDSDWYNVVQPHLHRSSDVIDGFDTIDARGTFQKNEVKRELKRLSREELENRLGISPQKIEEILRRADVKKNGEIDYQNFLRAVKEYRLCTEQESRLLAMVRVFAYTEEFSCSPPTFVMITITLLELGFFILTSLYLERDYGVSLGWDSPVPYCSPLIYDPTRRWELWRYITYMFVHIGIGHFLFNMLMQIIVGVFLEMSQEGVIGSFRVLAVYMAGVVAASLGTSLSDPGKYIAGASGGVYSLIAAHLATMALNWQEDSSVRIQKVVQKPLTRIIRLSFITLLTLHDVGYAVYVRIYDPSNRTGFMGHLCGALAGLLVGVFILDNRRVRSWEPAVQFVSLVLFLGMIIFAVVWNIWGNEWSPGFFPNPDPDLYEDYGKCRHYKFI